MIDSSSSWVPFTVAPRPDARHQLVWGHEMVVTSNMPGTITIRPMAPSLIVATNPEVPASPAIMQYPEVAQDTVSTSVVLPTGLQSGRVPVPLEAALATTPLKAIAASATESAAAAVPAALKPA